MKNLAVILARSGSKGLKDKNIKELLGKPLMAYSIEAALQSKKYDTVHVSTDSERYADIARAYGADVPFLRDASLAGDKANSWDALRSVVRKYAEIGKEFDTVTLLQPTSPLRDAEDIQNAFDIFEKKTASSVVSVCEVEHSPRVCNVLGEEQSLNGFLDTSKVGRRQDMDTFYRINGAIYIQRTNLLMDEVNIYGEGSYAYIMDKKKSVDIDDEFDFFLAEAAYCITKRRHMVEQDFLQLVQIAEQQQKRIGQLEHTTRVLISSNKQLIDWVDGIEKEMEDYKSNAPFELLTDQSKAGYWYPTVRSAEDTIELIINEGKSLARFGDGEFSAIAGRVRHRFQSEADEKLGQRLRQVLEAEEPKLLLGIANNYGSLDAYTDQAKREIRRYLQRAVRKEHLALLKPERVYCDAYVTRPYVMYADNRTDAPAARFLKLKQIWEQKDIVIVEGEQTKVGQGNDLLDNARSVKRVLGPAENAFREYDSILEKCFCFDKDKLFLLALGPTAAVLAYDLCMAGYQAIDIGHLDLEYEWFLKGEGKRVEIQGKYNNELPEKQLEK